MSVVASVLSIVVVSVVMGGGGVNCSVSSVHCGGVSCVKCKMSHLDRIYHLPCSDKLVILSNMICVFAGLCQHACVYLFYYTLIYFDSTSRSESCQYCTG